MANAPTNRVANMGSKNERSNKGMKLTSVERIERSQLIPGVLRTVWRSVTRKAVMIGLAIGAVGRVGPLSEDFESHYADVASARRAGAFDRGWLPEFIPDDAIDISELHNVATNLTWACFSNPRGPGELRVLLQKQRAKRVTGPVGGGPRTLFGSRPWWPVSMAKPEIEAYRVLEDQSFTLLVGVDTVTGRACFHRAVHP